MARRSSYVRDSSGRFSSTSGGGPARSSPGARRAKAKAKAKATGGTLAARSQLRAARAKLTPSASRQQRGAVTRASNRLKATGAAGRMKRPGAAMAGRIAKPKGLQRDPQAAAKLAAGQKGAPRGRQPNLRAQRAKEMANRTGVVPGRMFNDGQDVRTLSLAQMRAAVRQRLRFGGITTRKQYQFVYGKPPTTRSGWEQMYRQVVTSPQSDRNLKPRRGVVNGMDVQKNFRPWVVFGLNPKTATRADVEQAYRRVAKQVHPDLGGRRKDFERVKVMRDSLLALMPKPKAPKAPKGRGRGAAKAKASAPAAPQGPKLLPPARSAAPAPPARKPRRKPKPKP